VSEHTVSGWGRRAENGPTSNVLRRLKVAITIIMIIIICLFFLERGRYGVKHYKLETCFVNNCYI